MKTMATISLILLSWGMLHVQGSNGSQSISSSPVLENSIESGMEVAPRQSSDLNRDALPLVELTAEDLPDSGPVTTWHNRGQLGDFTAVGNLTAVTLNNVKAVQFDGKSYFNGPTSVASIEGAGKRSIEVWTYNSDVTMEESLVSWGHRGEAQGGNMGFIYGKNPNWGAAMHWGSSGNLGWWGAHSPAPAAHNWWHLAYTYDGSTARVYVNGIQESVLEKLTLKTYSGNKIRIGAQTDVTGINVNTVTVFIGCIASVRVYDTVLSQSALREHYELGVPGATVEDPNSDELANLVGRWSFDDGVGNVAHDSTGDFDALVDGAEWTTGVLGGALQFDGVDDSVNCGNDPRLAPVNLTVIAWVRPEDASGRTSVIGKGGSLFDADFDLLLVAGQARFEFGGLDGLDFVSLKSKGTVPSKEWSLITATRSGTVATLYVNGAEDSYQSYSFSPKVGDLPVVIGKAPYNGKIDDVRIYSSALASTEVRNLFGKVPPDEFLAAHWNFDEVRGTDVIDSVGGKNGVLHSVVRTDGIFGGALQFNGSNSYVEIRGNPNLPVAGYTVFLWARPETLSAVSALVTKERVQPLELEYRLALGSDRLLGFESGSTDLWKTRGINLAAGPISYKEWTAIGITNDGKTASLFVNGASMSAQSYESLPSIQGDSLKFGLPPYVGELDDVRVYRAALTGDQISVLYESLLHPGPIAHWSFDDGIGNVAHDSSGVFDAVVNGASWTQGVLGGALLFNGVDDSVNCGNDANLAPLNLTVSAWVWPESTSGRNSIVGKGGSLFEADFDLLIVSGQARFEFGSSDGLDFISLRSKATIPSKEWSLLTVMRTGSMATMYINGAEDTSQSYSFLAGVRDLPVVIGKPPYKGKIDDVRIYDLAIQEDFVQGQFDAASK